MPDTTTDSVFESFLEAMAEEAAALVAESDLVGIEPIQMRRGAPDRYILTLRCKGLVWGPEGTVHEADSWQLGIVFPPNHLRDAGNPVDIVHFFGPLAVLNPHIRPPFVCVGHIHPSTSITELAVRLHEIVSLQRCNLADPLDQASAEWVRNNPDRVPVDSRPLRRRTLDLHVTSEGGL